MPADGPSIFDLSQHRALVVGGGSGIGAASAVELARQGAEVVCADLDGEAASRTASEIRAAGGRASAESVDVTDSAQLEALAQDAGPLDSVILTPAVNVRKPLLATTDEEFDRVVDLNLKSVFRAGRAFGPAMVERRGGSIVAVSSIRSQVVEPGQGVYAATKAGIVQLTRALAAELGPYGVRANAVAPGVIDTPLTAPIRADREWYDAYADKTILRRWGSPREVAAAIVFLAAPASSYITGSLLVVDGGWLAHDGRFCPPL